MKVSVVTLTIKGRERFRDLCTDMIEAQSYSDIEHVIVSGEGSIGSKRNTGCGMATGDIILMLDDDDYISPTFIEKAVNFMQETGADITGLNNAYFYRPHDAMWEYKYAGGQPYVFGSAMMFKRSVLERTKFPDISSGEEIGFLTNAGRIIPHNFKNDFLAMIHGGNTASHKQLHTMKQLHPSLALSILGDSYKNY